MIEFDSIIDQLQNALGVSQGRFWDIVWTLLLFLIYFLIKVIASVLIRRYTKEAGQRYVSTKSVSYLLGIFLIIGIIRIWAGGLGGLMTYFAILSAGLAVALQAPLVNFAGWLTILLRRPFTVGDRIEINENAGDVIDIRLFQFSMMEIGNWVDADQSTGRITHIPNRWVFEHALANYTQGFNFIWNELSTVVTFESDWKKAKEILLGIGNDHNPLAGEQAQKEIRRTSEKFMIFYKHLNPIVWTDIVDIGVKLTIRYLCEPRQRRSTESEINEKILSEFTKNNDIDFAYPTQRMYFNPMEGKGPLQAEDGLKLDIDKPEK